MPAPQMPAESNHTTPQLFRAAHNQRKLPNAILFSSIRPLMFAMFAAEESGPRKSGLDFAQVGFRDWAFPGATLEFASLFDNPSLSVDW